MSLVYQPIVHVLDRRMVGVEALARWADSELGVAKTEKFIDVAEQTGLIAQLGERILDRALREMRELGLVERGVMINVNVSQRQLIDAGFAARLSTLLQRHQVPPGSWP